MGGLALLIGWIQFSSKTRDHNLRLHKLIGKVYIISALLSSLAGICIGFVDTGGILPSLGFICLGVTWFCTTAMAYMNIRKKQIEKHQKLMIYSYAACFAAVMLRIWLPLLNIIFGNFIPAYSIVAWLYWLPNILVASLITRRTKNYQHIIFNQKGLWFHAGR